MPGMCDTPAFLNLHLLLWDSYITDRMSGRLVSVEGRTSAADTHLAFARSQNCGKRHFGFLKKHKKKQSRDTNDGIKYERDHIDYKRSCTKDNLHRIKEAACHKAASFHVMWV